MPLFVPKQVFRNVTHIKAEYLKREGIKALVLDVDNTLTAHGSQALSPEIAAWLAAVKAEGIDLMIASNNTKARVAPFADLLDLDYVHFCCKPSPRWFMAAMKRWGYKRREIALVGDQIFTDLLAGQLYGVRVFLVRPMYEDSKPTIRFKRRLEKPLLLRYYKKGGKLL